MSVPLATFDLNDPQQQAVATELQRMLDGLNFDEANQTLHLGTYGISPIYDNQVLSMADLHPERTMLDRRQVQAIEFFMYGGLISPEEASCLFQNNLSLFGEMQNLGLIVADTDETGSVSYRLNNLSIISHHLPNDNVIYLAVDLPERFRNIDSSKPTAQISETSYVLLLNRLEKWYKEGGVTKGVVADFGAGTGLFVIVLLKLFPNIEEALAVEIDPQAMNLNRLNAPLNGVANRIAVVDNFEENGFSHALGERQLDFAISNPPFNVVPRGYSEQFTDFGDGGEKGLDITQIFLDQALPNLKAGGEFMLYSVLAEDPKGNYFATRLLEEECFTVRYEHLRLDNLTYTQESYATVLADYLERNRDHGLLRLWGEGPDQALVSDIQGKLNECAKKTGASELGEKSSLVKG